MGERLNSSLKKLPGSAAVSGAFSLLALPCSAGRMGSGGEDGGEAEAGGSAEDGNAEYERSLLELRLDRSSPLIAEFAAEENGKDDEGGA